MFKVIYGTEQFFAQKLEVNFCSKQIAVWKFTKLGTIGIVNYWLFVENLLPSKIPYFFVEKPRISAKYVCITFAQYCVATTGACYQAGETMKWKQKVEN